MGRVFDGDCGAGNGLVRRIEYITGNRTGVELSRETEARQEDRYCGPTHVWPMPAKYTLRAPRNIKFKRRILR